MQTNHTTQTDSLEADPHGPAPGIEAMPFPGTTHPPPVPAPTTRPWLFDPPARYAMRCRPLIEANHLGWFLLAPAKVMAVWHGPSPAKHLDNPQIDAVKILEGHQAPAVASAHFGNGVLTFHVPFLFTADPGIQLLVTGPVNHPKDGISPLTGLVVPEVLAPFTMNWKFTTAGKVVTWESGEPYAQIIPLTVHQGDCPAVLVTPQDRPKRYAAWQRWCESRNKFNQALAGKDPNPAVNAAAQEKGWQGDYNKESATRFSPSNPFTLLSKKE